MLQFPYQDEPVTGLPPPSLPPGSTVRWRPLVPVMLVGPIRGLQFNRALLDSAADDTVFPSAVAGLCGVVLRPDTGHRVRWRGQAYPLRFGDAELSLSDGLAEWRWPTVMAFSPAPISYPILGNAKPTALL